MSLIEKSSVDEIRERFDRDVERFSNLATGQSATIDALKCMNLIATAASSATPKLRRVLDLGCGAGNYSLKLRECVPTARFTLVDLSQPMLDRARERLGDSVEATLQNDLRLLEFAPGSFDVILASAVLHHLRTPAEWTNTFAAMHRWLRPSGSVWIFDLVSHEDENIQGLLWAQYGRYLEDLAGQEYREKVFSYIEREDTPIPVTEQLARLKAAGFATVDLLHKNSCFAAFGAVKSST